MVAERLSSAGLFRSPQSESRGSVATSNSKLKIEFLAPPAQRGGHWYPSPPMSRPPSPPRPHFEDHVPTFSQPAWFVTSGEAVPIIRSQSSRYPAQLPPLQNPPTTSRPSSSDPSHSGSHREHHLLPAPASASTLDRSGSLMGTTPPGLPPISSTPSPPAPKTRGAKAHVAIACVHCKRAHLSCDNNRPCGRCVSSGKQESCHNVQQKPRGRPRRQRHEDRFRGVQTPTHLASSNAASLSGFPTVLHPVTQSRDHRERTDSIRSLPSQMSDESLPTLSAFGYPHLSPPVNAGAPTYQHRPSEASTSPADIPTVFLDLDLVILRANQGFHRVMHAERELEGCRLTDVATPMDVGGFHNLLTLLRHECYECEPSSMPPRIARGIDSIQGISEGDIERLSHGFVSRPLTLRRNNESQNREELPARLSLAKANVYFIVMDLPTLRMIPPRLPASISSIPQDRSFLRGPSSSFDFSRSIPQSEQPPLLPPPPAIQSYLNEARIPSLSLLAGPSSHIRYSALHAPFSASLERQPGPIGPPQLPPPGISSITAQRPRSPPSESVQLAPMLTAGPASVDPSSAGPSNVGPPSVLAPPIPRCRSVARAEGEEEDERDGERSAKRRKMDISDVLQ